MTQDGRVLLRGGWVEPSTGQLCVAEQPGSLSSRERQLLAALMERHGQPVSRDALLEEVWGGHATSARTVDNAVRRLRSRLERDPGRPEHVLTVHGEGYRFVPDPPEDIEPVPLAAPVEAVQVYGVGEAQLALSHAEWRDARGTVVTLTTKEVGVLRVLVAADGSSVSREELQREVWGHRRRATLRYVDYVVHGLRKKIEPDPAQPTHLLTVAGVGYRLAGAPGGAAAPAPPPSTNLGTEATSFVGRAHELAWLTNALEQGARLLTIAGAGGSGKTRLARRLAREHLSRGEVWFFGLARCAELGQVLEVVARTLDLHGAPHSAAAIGRALDARGDVLVILDNVEQVRGDLGAMVADWLRTSRDVRFVVTSRSRLQVVEEHVLPLGPLGAEDASRLYVERVRQLRPGYTPATEESAVVQQLCTALDGLPLAIEFAAARATVLTPADTIEQLQQRFAILTRGRSDRHGSLWAAISWSWDMLTHSQRSLLAQLSVFRAAFDLEAVEGVVRIEAEGAPTVLELLESLVQHSLVRTLETRSGLRFSLFVSLREFAATKLAQEGRPEAVALQHATWFAARADRWRALGRRGDRRASEGVHTDSDELWAAVRFSADSHPTVAARCLGALCLETNRWGPDTCVDLLEWTDRVLGTLDPLTQATDMAWLLCHRWAIHRRRSEYERARTELEHAHDLPGLDPALRARVALDLTLVAHQQGHAADARHFLDEARRLGAPQPWFQAKVAQLQGMIALGGGHTERAIEAYEEARRCYVRLGNEEKAALQLGNIGTTRIRQGRHEEAAAIFAEGAAHFERQGKGYWTAWYLYSLADAEAQGGDLRAAEGHARRSAELAARCGARHIESQVLHTLAGILRVQGAPADEVLSLRRRIIARDRASGAMGRVLIALLNFVSDAMWFGDVEQSEGGLQEAKAVARGLGSIRGEAYAEIMRACHAGLWGNRAQVDAAVAASERALATLDDPEGEATLRAARAFVDLADARAGSPEALGRLRALLAQPWPDSERFDQVGWARVLLTRGVDTLDAG